MRMFSESRLARSIACILTAVFAWSMGFSGFTLLPAEAQIVTRAATTQSVAVIPFENRTNVRPETLGTEAAAAVSVELRDRLLLDVLPKADVTLQMRDLGMREPLSDVELVRLATELDVSLVITGEVRGARIAQGPEGRSGEVVLAVRLFDRVARVAVNGAVAIGKGPASPGASDELLLEKALAQAAFSAVDQMKARPTVTGMVLWARGETVFLNVGTRGGIRNGMHMVAVRGGERIGKVEVTNADAIGSYADIIEGPPLRTGDHLRAVYTLPRAAGIERVGVAEKKKKRFETIILAGAVLFGFGNYASRTRKLDEGNIAAPGFRARQIANGAELGVSGYMMSYIFPLRDIQPHSAALVTWDAYQGTERSRIIGYEVRRNFELVDVVVGVAGQENVVYDVPFSPSFRTLEIIIDQVSGGVAEITSDSEGWDPDFEVDEETGEVTINSPWFEFVDDHIEDAGIFVSEDSITYGWFPSDLPGDDYGGMYPGRYYQYRIRPLLVRQNRDGIWEFDHGTEFSTVANDVVAVSPAGAYSVWYREGEAIGGVYQTFDILLNPQIQGNLATFGFYYPVGADEVILQIATDPEFAQYNVRQVDIDPVEGDFFTHKSMKSGVDLSLVPGNLGPGSVLWWRIGARNSNDTHEPVPIPDDPDERGWIWSHRRSFQIPLSGSRAAAMHEQPDRLSSVRAAGARVPRTANTERVLRAQ